jgi:hypothetical protein
MSSELPLTADLRIDVNVFHVSSDSFLKLTFTERRDDV